MIKIVVILLAIVLITMVFGVPVVPNYNDSSQIQVVQFENKSNKTGKYSIIYELSNGIVHSESGVLSDGSDNQSIAGEGTYWFVGPDGVTYEVNYYFDEDGFHPLGPPTGINQGVLKSLVG